MAPELNGAGPRPLYGVFLFMESVKQDSHVLDAPASINESKTTSSAILPTYLTPPPHPQYTPPRFSLHSLYPLKGPHPAPKSPPNGRGRGSRGLSSPNTPRWFWSRKR